MSEQALGLPSSGLMQFAGNVELFFKSSCASLSFPLGGSKEQHDGSHPGRFSKSAFGCLYRLGRPRFGRPFAEDQTVEIAGSAEKSAQMVGRARSLGTAQAESSRSSDEKKPKGEHSDTQQWHLEPAMGLTYKAPRESQRGAALRESARPVTADLRPLPGGGGWPPASRESSA